MNERRIYNLIFLQFWIVSLSDMIPAMDKLCVIFPDIINFFILISLFSLRWKDVENVLRLSFGNISFILLSFFVLLGLISSVVNLFTKYETLLSMFWGIRTYLRFFIPVIAIVLTFNEEKIYKVLNWIETLFILNIVIVAYQYIILDKNGDSIGGTFSGNGGLMLVLITGIIVYSVKWQQHQIPITKFLTYFVMGMLCSFVAEIKYLYFILPAIMVMSFFIVDHFKKGLIIAIFGFTLFVPLMTIGLSLIYERDYIEKSLDYDQNVEYLSKEGGQNFDVRGVNRSTALMVVDKRFYSKDPIQRYIGHGWGSGSISSFVDTYIGDKWGGAVAYFFFQTSLLLVETGWLGFIIFVAFWIAFLIYSYQIRDLLPSDLYQELNAISVILIIICISLIYYSASLTNDKGYLLYYVFALPIAYIRNCEIENIVESE